MILTHTIIKKIYFFPLLLSSIPIFSQVGINNNSPKATLDVAAVTSNGTRAEGFIPPRITGDALRNANNNNLYGAAQNGTIVFVTSPAAPANQIAQTIDITTAGMYLFDSSLNKWVRININSNTIPIASVTSLGCNTAMTYGSIDQGTAASGVATILPYTGGNGSPYNVQAVSSTGVTGLTASLLPGNLANGNGTLTFNITGVPSSRGMAYFNVIFGGQSCTFFVPVGCGAYIAPGQWKEFMCRNLGADNTADPFIPSASIHGAKYQWGAQTGESGRYLSQADDQANSGVVSGWNTTALPAGTWSDTVKTAADPCPSGYRVPTISQLEGIVSNNGTPVKTGTWANSSTNYGTAIKYGNLLMPAAGGRSFSNGVFINRGNMVFYYSSSSSSATNVKVLVIENNTQYTSTGSGQYGFSIRCIKE